MNTIKSAFFALDHNDFIRGLVVAVLAAVFTFFAQLMQLPGFTFSGIDWGQIFQMAVMAGTAYIGKNLGSTADGKFLGKIG